MSLPKFAKFPVFYFFKVQQGIFVQRNNYSVSHRNLFLLITDFTSKLITDNQQFISQLYLMAMKIIPHKQKES